MSIPNSMFVVKTLSDDEKSSFWRALINAKNLNYVECNDGNTFFAEFVNELKVVLSDHNDQCIWTNFKCRCTCSIDASKNISFNDILMEMVDVMRCVVSNDFMLICEFKFGTDLNQFVQSLGYKEDLKYEIYEPPIQSDDSLLVISN